MFFSDKAIGIEIHQDGVRMVQTGGKPHQPALDAYSAASFPADTLRYSIRDENVKNPAAFISKIREARLKLPAAGNRVSVSLPDAVGRVLLLDLETRFRTHDEGGDIIRWKLKRTFPFDINEMHLDYQVLREKTSGEIAALVSLVARSVIIQYEDLLLEAGLQPNRIDFTTFNIYRLFYSHLQMTDNIAIAILHESTLSLLIFNNGILDFFRAKELPVSANGANRIFHEMNSSLLAYKELQPGYTMNKVFCVVSDAEDFPAIVAEATDLQPVLLDPGRIVTVKDGTVMDARTFHALAPALGAAVRNL